MGSKHRKMLTWNQVSTVIRVVEKEKSVLHQQLIFEFLQVISIGPESVKLRNNDN